MLPETLQCQLFGWEVDKSLFKTLEECDQKCKEINQGESGTAF